MVITDDKKLMQFLTGPDFSPNNLGYDFEGRQIRGNYFVHDHHATQLPVVVLKAKSVSKQTGYMDATKARYWYRAMTKEEFDYLVNNFRLNINYEDVVEEGGVAEKDNRYIGIATNSTYASEYMGNLKKHTHLIEFEVQAPLNLHDEIQKTKLKGENVSLPKPEGNGGTYGLGMKGQYQGRAGECFNGLLKKDQIYWRIVLLYLTYNCPDKIGNKYQ
jgi:hypothetical protein